jgi:hypothetical protein
VSIHSFVEWLDTFSYVLRPADVTVEEVNHIRCFAIDIAKYLILLSCRSQYVGESVQPFNKRMNGHRSDLMKKSLLSVSQHFVSPGHSLEDFGRSQIYIIDHNPSWKENQRQKKESFWIKKLKNKRFRPFCLCLPGVMFVTCGSKNSLFSVFDFLSNLDCGQ